MLINNEKMISPEGTYPVLGRSMGYRFGAFQVLAQVSWMKLLPEHIKPAQVRCALTKVMKRQLAKGTFDKDGWLNLGFCGHQPRLPTDMYLLAVIICVLLFSCLWVYRRMMNSGRPSLRNGLRLKYGAEVVI